jgi:predicted HTH transcriptional regulator
MSRGFISKLIDAGESDVLDFKKTISSASKIAKTLSAFSNHKGGRLLIGVNDNKTISGVKSEDEKYMLDMAARFYCKPEVELQIIEWELNDKMILEAIIPEGENKPYYAKGEDGKWWVHVRVKDKTLLASKIVVDVLRRQTDRTNTFIQYSRHEQSLLQHLEKNERITLQRICNLLNVSRWRAQKIVVNLVSIGVLSAHTTEKTEFYMLS